MNSFFSLLKLELNNTFSFSKTIEEIKSGKDLGKKIMMLVVVLSMIPILILLYSSLNRVYDFFKEVGKEQAFLLLGGLSVLLLELTFGFVHILSKYYFSEDVSILLPLPIKRSHIVGSKFISALFRDYIFVLPLFLIFLIVYGNNNLVGLSYYIYSILGLLTIGVFPLFLVSIFLMIFMKYTNLSANRDRLRIIFSVIFILIIILLQSGLGKISEDGKIESKILVVINDYSDQLLDNTIIKLTPIYLLSKALIGSESVNGLINIFGYIIYLVVIFSIMLYLADKLYLDGLIAQRSKRDKNSKQGEISYKSGSISLAIFKKEILLLIRTPIYMINTIAGILVGPAMFFIVLGQMDKGPKGMGLSLGITVLFLNIAVIASATSLSREGDKYWINQALPISPKSQTIGRILASFLITLIQIILIVFVFAYRLKLSLLNTILFLLINISSGLMATIVGLYVDIKSPKLDWDTPEDAMKRNINVLKSMLINTIIIGFTIGLSFFFIKRLGPSIAISSIALLIIAYLYYKKTIDQFKKI